MTPDILTTSAAISGALSRLFSKATRSRRRIILSAYVGAEAPTLLPDVQGVALYCWPQSGATNPHAIRQLRRMGARISFVDRLHMKVYWVEGEGAVIGSANLSSNALGIGGLFECGVFLPANRGFPIEALLRSLPARPMTPTALAKLQREHDLFWSRNRPKGKGAWTSASSFKQWAQDPRSNPWKFSWWGDEGDEAKSTAEAVRRDFDAEVYDFIDCTNDHFAAGDWVLLYRLLANDLPGNLSWLFVDKVYAVPKGERTDPDFTHQAVQIGPLGARRPPFVITPSFQRHFRAAVRDYGASKLAHQNDVVLPARLIAALLRRSGLTTA